MDTTMTHLPYVSTTTESMHSHDMTLDVKSDIEPEKKHHLIIYLTLLYCRKTYLLVMWSAAAR